MNQGHNPFLNKNNTSNHMQSNNHPVTNVSNLVQAQPLNQNQSSTNPFNTLARNSGHNEITSSQNNQTSTVSPFNSRSIPIGGGNSNFNTSQIFPKQTQIVTNQLPITNYTTNTNTIQNNQMQINRPLSTISNNTNSTLTNQSYSQIQLQRFKDPSNPTPQTSVHFRLSSKLSQMQKNSVYSSAIHHQNCYIPFTKQEMFLFYMMKKKNKQIKKEDIKTYMTHVLNHKFNTLTKSLKTGFVEGREFTNEEKEINQKWINTVNQDLNKDDTFDFLFKTQTLNGNQLSLGNNTGFSNNSLQNNQISSNIVSNVSPFNTNLNNGSRPAVIGQFQNNSSTNNIMNVFNNQQNKSIGLNDLSSLGNNLEIKNFNQNNNLLQSATNNQLNSNNNPYNNNYNQINQQQSSLNNNQFNNTLLPNNTQFQNNNLLSSNSYNNTSNNISYNPNQQSYSNNILISNQYNNNMNMNSNYNYNQNQNQQVNYSNFNYQNQGIFTMNDLYFLGINFIKNLEKEKLERKKQNKDEIISKKQNQEKEKIVDIFANKEMKAFDEEEMKKPAIVYQKQQEQKERNEQTKIKADKYKSMISMKDTISDKESQLCIFNLKNQVSSLDSVSNLNTLKNVKSDYLQSLKPQKELPFQDKVETNTQISSKKIKTLKNENPEFVDKSLSQAKIKDDNFIIISKIEIGIPQDIISLQDCPIKIPLPSNFLKETVTLNEKILIISKAVYEYDFFSILKDKYSNLALFKPNNFKLDDKSASISVIELDNTKSLLTQCKEIEESNVNIEIRLKMSFKEKLDCTGKIRRDENNIILNFDTEHDNFTFKFMKIMNLCDKYDIALELMLKLTITDNFIDLKAPLSSEASTQLKNKKAVIRFQSKTEKGLELIHNKILRLSYNNKRVIIRNGGDDENDSADDDFTVINFIELFE